MYTLDAHWKAGGMALTSSSYEAGVGRVTTFGLP